MDKRKKQGAGSGFPPDKHNGKSKKPMRRCPNRRAQLAGNEKLIERIRQILSETPDIRTEKVGPLQEALARGTYSIDVRKLANILISKLILEP
jgi:flagellar biosynthesis anti-sigma factor FlgM